MPLKKEPAYEITVIATGTTLELIHAFQDVLDALYHGDHRRKDRTVTSKNKTVTYKKVKR